MISVHVSDGFQNKQKWDRGRVGGVSTIQFFWIFRIYSTLQSRSPVQEIESTPGP